MKRFGLIVATVASVALLGAPALVPRATVEAKSNTETYRVLDVFAAVFERVRSDYVEEVSDETLVESAINGMLTTLDPHSSYLNAKNYKDMQVQTRGEFGGLGVEVTMDNGVIKVVSPIDDTPAAKAGIKPNDLIVQVDGQPVAGLTLADAVEKMRGPVNSDIKLTVLREGRDPFDVTLTRAIVKIQSVKSHLEGDNVGYICITSFNEQTDSGLQNAVKNLKQQAGNKLVGYVLDLRNNPGGLLEQAIAVWNDIIVATVMLPDQTKSPLTLGLFNFQGQYSNEWALLAAATLIVAAPLMIAYLCLQRFLVSGVIGGAVKG